MGQNLKPVRNMKNMGTKTDKINDIIDGCGSNHISYIICLFILFENAIFFLYFLFKSYLGQEAPIKLL